MTLHELKRPFESIYKTASDTYLNCSSEELVDLLTNNLTADAKNQIVSILIYRSWQSLVNIFYKQQNSSLTEEECYDIFLEAFDYVCETKPWKKENNSLNNDKDAFIKSMMQCTTSRKVNYIIAQHRQKRIVNCTAASVDALQEDFQDGYFTPYYDRHIDKGTGTVYSLIKDFFTQKQYLYAFILDAILTIDLYNDESRLDIRKLRKYLRSLTDIDCKYFSYKYKLNTEEVTYSLKYFQNLSTEKLTNKIKECIMLLHDSSIIKEAVQC